MFAFALLFYIESGVIKVAELIKNVGERIRTIRKIRGFTQESLAEKTGLQNTYISDVERGDRNISLETLEKIIEALEVNAVDLFQFPKENEHKVELIKTLEIVLSNKSSKEVEAIYKIVNEIFNNFGSEMMK